MVLSKKCSYLCGGTAHKKDICTLLVQHCVSLIAYRNEARGGGKKRQMGNNRKDTSDQPGEGKKYCQRNGDEIVWEKKRESNVAAAAKLFA